ncbi:MAG: hypothetical protein ACTHOL_11925, partial [Luteibacter jiangsuensis]
MTFLNCARSLSGRWSLLLTGGLLVSSIAFGQEAKPVSPVVKINEAAATAPIESTPLRGSLTMLSGSGGNITVLNGKEGQFLVDAGIAVSRPRVEAALRALGNG